MAAYGFQFQRPQGKVLNCTKFDSATAVAGYCWSNVASNATLECLQELLRMWSGCSQQHKSKWPLWLLSQESELGKLAFRNSGRWCFQKVSTNSWSFTVVAFVPRNNGQFLPSSPRSFLSFLGSHFTATFVVFNSVQNGFRHTSRDL